jgi:threonine dehydrogenase-like Zn-dependent dehydrogenase
VELIMEATGGAGVDRGVEAVGYQAHDATGEEHPELVLDNLVEVVRSTGAIGVVGVYVPEDPGAAGDLAREGRVPFKYGRFFSRGHRMGTGQCPVKPYNRELRDLIVAGRASPSLIVSHELALTEGVEAYDAPPARPRGRVRDDAGRCRWSPPARPRRSHRGPAPATSGPGRRAASSARPGSSSSSTWSSSSRSRSSRIRC